VVTILTRAFPGVTSPSHRIWNVIVGVWVLGVGKSNIGCWLLPDVRETLPVTLMKNTGQGAVTLDMTGPGSTIMLPRPRSSVLIDLLPSLTSTPGIASFRVPLRIFSVRTSTFIVGAWAPTSRAFDPETTRATIIETMARAFILTLL
jgi:hypothetical protein